jgi:hypothetical protein
MPFDSNGVGGRINFWNEAIARECAGVGSGVA